MKKAILAIVLTAFLLTSCGSPAVDIKLEKFDLTLSGPEPKKAPEYKALSFDKMIGRYNFYIGKSRMNVEEMEQSIFPENVKMVSDIISTSEGFESFLKGDKYPNGSAELSNGAYGVLYSKKNSKGNLIKDYVFYFKKGGRFFRIVPVFNNDLDGLDEQLAAIESLK